MRFTRSFFKAMEAPTKIEILHWRVHFAFCCYTQNWSWTEISWTGHTYMECDSVHATIGRKTNDKNVYIPRRYVELIEESREGDKYRVKYVNHSFFKDYTWNTTGQSVGSPVVTDLRVLRYTTDGHIMYKFNYSDEEFCKLTRQRNAPINFKEPVPAAYTRALPLKISKYAHLQKLKEVIPQDYHAFYNQLPHTYKMKI